ncbi:MAG: DUF6489 family protein [Bdellovibrionales bacterium]
MKVNFDIECTPEEARKFFGLPDVAPMQERMMKELEDKMLDNLKSMDPDKIVQTWLPATIQGWGEMQKLFWQQMGMPGTAAGQSSSGSKTSKTSDKKA